MDILIIGGTVFLGRHFVAAALQAGHHVTMFNRGSTTLIEQGDAERIVGDRGKDLDLLHGRHFDAVIDTCGYMPDIVSQSTLMLKDLVANYVFISSISAYKNFRQMEMNENGELKCLQSGDANEYGALKAECEKVVATNMSDRCLIVRPGLIVGPYDPTGRFAYWPLRLARGGKILAPGRKERQIQFIDVRDLALWLLKMVEGAKQGIYNATGPDYSLSMEQFLNECQEASGSTAELIWVGDAALAKASVTPWMEVPLWLPDSDEDARGFLSIDCTKARGAGLNSRPTAETIKDTLAWNLSRPADAQSKAGLSQEREQQILQS